MYSTNTIPNYNTFYDDFVAHFVTNTNPNYNAFYDDFVVPQSTFETVTAALKVDFEYLHSHTRDLQGLNKVEEEQQNSKNEKIRSESPLSNSKESSCASIIQAMITKPCPCTPQQKKEKIDKYRCKRTQRNFNKKIKYECRKTLADSRPRIRGRFAKNEGSEKTAYNNTNTAHQYWINHDDQLSGDIEEHDQLQLDDDINWVNFLNAFSSNLIP